MKINLLESHISYYQIKDKNNLLSKISNFRYQRNFLFYVKGNVSNPLRDLTKPRFDAFVGDSFLVIKREKFEDLSNIVLFFIESSLLSRLDECFDLAISTLMFHLTFYNDLLEKQNRYEQEIPQKWQAEKQSLDQLRSQIDKVQTEIDTILNSISTS